MKLKIPWIDHKHFSILFISLFIDFGVTKNSNLFSYHYRVDMIKSYYANNNNNNINVLKYVYISLNGSYAASP